MTEALTDFTFLTHQSKVILAVIHLAGESGCAEIIAYEGRSVNLRPTPLVDVILLAWNHLRLV